MVVDPRFTGGMLDPRFTPAKKSTAWTAGSGATLYMSRPQIDPTQARGFAYPFKFANGKPVVSEGTDHILQGIAFLLKTVPGTYPFAPDYGCDLGRRVFDPTNQMALASRDIRAALARWEPRATLEDLEINTDAALGVVTFVLRLRIDDQLRNMNLALGGSR